MNDSSNRENTLARPGNRFAAATLATAVAGALLASGNAHAFLAYGVAVDEYCTDFNGTTPYAEQSCVLCHVDDYSEPVQPAWNWWENDELQNFCAQQEVVVANTAPELSPIGDQTGQQGYEMAFTIEATDADEDNLEFSASDLPTGATLEDNGDGTADFSWTPNDQQSGNYPVTFTVTDDGDPVESDYEEVTLSIDAGDGVINQPPVLEPIGDRPATIGQEVSFTVYATDPENGGLVLTTANLPEGAYFTDNLDGSGSFSWTPQAGQAGAHSVRFTATDDGVPQASDYEDVSIVVAGGNSAPELAPIGNRMAPIGEQLQINISAEDVDGDTLEFSANNLPTGAELNDNGDGTATLYWTPSEEQSGQHQITVYVSDDYQPPESDSETFTVTAGDGNQPPVLSPIGMQTAYAGQPLDLAISASDPDGDPLTFSASGLPGGAELYDYGNGTAQLRWTPNGGESPYNVTVMASDGDSYDVETFELTTRQNQNGNYAPVNAAANTAVQPANVTWTASGSPWLLLGMGLIGLLARRRKG